MIKRKLWGGVGAGGVGRLVTMAVLFIENQRHSLVTLHKRCGGGGYCLNNALFHKGNKGT